jgi:hypothetical protein
MVQVTKNIETLIEDGGEISLAWSNDVFIDEVNDGESSSSRAAPPSRGP